MTKEETRRLQIDNFNAVVESTMKAIKKPGGYKEYWKQMFYKYNPGVKPTRGNVKRFVAKRLYENEKDQWWFKDLKEKE